MQANFFRRVVPALISHSVKQKKVLTVAPENFKVSETSNNVRLFHQTPVALKDICKTINYAELRDVMCDPKAVIIDIRERGELKEAGRVPGAHHIPLNEIEKALDLGPAKFKAKYGFDKPETYTKIVFSCRLGKGTQACEIAEKEGYRNLWNYQAGFTDWCHADHEKHPKKCKKCRK